MVPAFALALAHALRHSHPFLANCAPVFSAQFAAVPRDIRDRHENNSNNTMIADLRPLHVTDERCQQQIDNANRALYCTMTYYAKNGTTILYIALYADCKATT